MKISRLQEIISESHQLVERTFACEFDAPVLRLNSKHIRIPAKPAAQSVYYGRPINHEYTITFQRQAEHLEDGADLRYGLLLETSHALIFSMGQRNSSADSMPKKTEKQSPVWLAFYNGLSEYITFRSSVNSGNYSLVEKAKERDLLLKNGMETVIQGALNDVNQFNKERVRSPYESIDPDDMEGLLLSYLKRNPILLDRYGSCIGYAYARNSGREVLQMILEPPKELYELIYLWEKPPLQA